MDKKLNLVSLTIPWPANYGGVIDIYYKIKALHDWGVKIILHCFEYDRPHTPELEELCEEVYYYRRRTGLLSNLSFLPYNVFSRRDKRLLEQLLKNDYPILFEGLHTCYYLKNRRLRDRFKIFRECNIEHDYYRAIRKAERNILKKCFFYIETIRFKRYQKNVSAAQLMLAISQKDTDYLRQVFPQHQIEFIPCFHGNNLVTTLTEKADFILYHGKLSVQENEKAALYLIENIFSQLLTFRCIIAGMNPSAKLLKAASRYKNIVVEVNPPLNRMNELIHTAHINLLVTFQDTGLKLKLLNSLFTGRHVVANSMMLAGSGLDSLCHIADRPEQMIHLCSTLMSEPVTEETIETRRKLLFPQFSGSYQAKRIIDLIP
jgi:hypothetical protein